MPPVAAFLAANAATIGTVASVGSALYGANKQAKTAKQVANMEAKTADQNRLLAQEQYERASRTLQPQVDRGEYAGSVLDTMYLGNMAPRRLYGSQKTGYAVQNRLAPSQNAMAQNPNYLLPAKEQRVVGQSYTMNDGRQAMWDGRGFRATGGGAGGFSNAAR